MIDFFGRLQKLITFIEKNRKKTKHFISYCNSIFKIFDVSIRIYYASYFTKILFFLDIIKLTKLEKIRYTKNIREFKLLIKNIFKKNVLNSNFNTLVFDKFLCYLLCQN